MGIEVPPIFRRKPKARVGNAQYALTPLGKQKAEQFSTENPQSIILDIINDKSPCDIEEIAEEAKITPQKASIIVKTLKAKGYVRPVNEE